MPKRKQKGIWANPGPVSNANRGTRTWGARCGQGSGGEGGEGRGEGLQSRGTCPGTNSEGPVPETRVQARRGRRPARDAPDARQQGTAPGKMVPAGAVRGRKATKSSCLSPARPTPTTDPKEGGRRSNDSTPRPGAVSSRHTLQCPSTEAPGPSTVTRSVRRSRPSWQRRPEQKPRRGKPIASTEVILYPQRTSPGVAPRTGTVKRNTTSRSSP